MRKLVEVYCAACGHPQDELLQHGAAMAPFGAVQEGTEDYKCEKCGSEEKPIRAPNGYRLDFKGSGFYTTDYNGKRG